MLFSVVLLLNCFKTASLVVYNKQDQMVTFTADPNTALGGQELQICKQLSGKAFDAMVMIGTATFEAQRLEFDFDVQTTFLLTCSSSQTKLCNPENVNLFQIANFQLSFLDVDIQLSGSAGKFSIRWFDRTDCNNEGLIQYSIQKDDEHMSFQVSSRANCPVTPSTDALRLSWQINGVTMISTNTTFQELRNSNENTSRIDSAENYIGDLKKFQFDCRTENNVLDNSCYETTLKVVTNPTERFTMVSETDYQTSKIDPTTQKRKVLQNTQQATSVFRLVQPAFEDGCYDPDENIITFFANQVSRHIKVGSLRNCSHKVFRRFYDYDKIRVQYSAVQNADFTGVKANMNIMFPGESVQYAKSYQSFFSCNSSEDEAECVKSAELMRVLPKNTSVSMNHFLLSPNGTLLQKFQFPLILNPPVFTHVGVYFLQDQICLKIPDIEEEATYLSKVLVTDGRNTYDMQYDCTFKPENELYCAAYTSSQLKQVEALAQQTPNKINAMITVDSLKIPPQVIEFSIDMKNINYLWISALAGLITTTGLAFGCKNKLLK